MTHTCAEKETMTPQAAYTDTYLTSTHGHFWLVFETECDTCAYEIRSELAESSELPRREFASLPVPALEAIAVAI